MIFLKRNIRNPKIGVDVIQLGEPVLTLRLCLLRVSQEVLCVPVCHREKIQQKSWNLHASKSSVISKINKKLSMSALHVCRGMEQKEEILLEGPYTPLVELFSKSGCDNLSLEFSRLKSRRTQGVLADDRINSDIILGLGVLNPRRMDEQRV